MPLNIPFDNTYAGLPEGFFSSRNPTPVKAPSLIAFNKDLANLLGFNGGDIDEMAQTFAGNVVPTGAAPLAQLYAGHQFGNYNPAKEALNLLSDDQIEFIKIGLKKGGRKK